jgi:hypothetical protein
MIASECKHASTLLRMVVDLLAELLGNCANRKGILHIAVFGIRLGHKFFVGVHSVIMMQIITQFLVELSEEAILDQG